LSRKVHSSGFLRAQYAMKPSPVKEVECYTH